MYLRGLGVFIKLINDEILTEGSEFCETQILSTLCV